MQAIIGIEKVHIFLADWEQPRDRDSAESEGTAQVWVRTTGYRQLIIKNRSIIDNRRFSFQTKKNREKGRKINQKLKLKVRDLRQTRGWILSNFLTNILDS